MRLKNLEEGSFWGRDDLVKRMKDEEKASGMKKFVKIDDDGSHHGVTTSDKEKWEELKAQGYKEDKNYFEEGGEGSGPKHKEVTVTKDGKSKVVKKIAAKVFTDAGWKVEEGKSPHKKGTAKYKKHMAAMHAESKDEPIQVREAGSPWTTTGKHPEKMTTDELWAEIAVFDHIQDRGETLSPKDMMRLDSLFSYMDTAEMNEAIKRKADSMMESAMWKAKRNK